MNKLGFGFLRLPVAPAGEIDLSLLDQMTDVFLAHGQNYFDTAYTYLAGKSEWAIRESLVKRHPRSSFLLADKLPGYKMTSHEDCYRYFKEQQDRCQVDFFDVYLLHWLNGKHYEIAEKYREFEFLEELKKTGKAIKTGFSYHDSADLLDEILTRHPEVDYVQLQINYLDWESSSIQSRRCYETAVKHGKRSSSWSLSRAERWLLFPKRPDGSWKNFHRTPARPPMRSGLQKAFRRWRSSSAE